MANDQNTWNGIGRLTRDAETKYTNSGKEITSFSIASSYYGGQNNADAVNFFDVDAWDCKVAQYMIKGKQVAITGELRQERWEQDSQTRSKVKIVAHRIQLLGDAKQRTGSAPAASEDDIPF